MEIFGILNVTPDSFSDGGKYIELTTARSQVKLMIEEGATIIDVGGESTRPGAHFVSEEEEIKRVVDVITMIKQQFDVEVSIDTYKASVARAAIEAGATIINDVKANEYDGKMLELVANTNVKYVAMHSRNAHNILADIKTLFDKVLNKANSLGIDQDQIILDPGIGFNKTTNDNLLILKNLSQLRQKYPNNDFLLGTSRKRFIGEINKLSNANERVIGTVATTIHGYNCGVKYVRVHDIKENKQAIEMIKAIDNYE